MVFSALAEPNMQLQLVGIRAMTFLGSLQGVFCSGLNGVTRGQGMVYVLLEVSSGVYRSFCHICNEMVEYQAKEVLFHPTLH